MLHHTPIVASSRLLSNSCPPSSLPARRTTRAIARVLPRRQPRQARHEFEEGLAGGAAARDVDGDGAATPSEAAMPYNTKSDIMAQAQGLVEHGNPFIAFCRQMFVEKGSELTRWAARDTRARAV